MSVKNIASDIKLKALSLKKYRDLNAGSFETNYNRQNDALNTSLENSKHVLGLVTFVC